jgi:hypothetical protein
MNEILHLLGLCPESMTHFDVMDIMFTDSFVNIWYLQKNIISLIKLKIRLIWDQLVITTGMLQIGLKQ